MWSSASPPHSAQYSYSNRSSRNSGAVRPSWRRPRSGSVAMSTILVFLPGEMLRLHDPAALLYDGVEWLRLAPGELPDGSFEEFLDGPDVVALTRGVRGDLDLPVRGPDVVEVGDI